MLELTINIRYVSCLPQGNVADQSDLPGNVK